ncbi:hypothetical protein ACIBI8_10985 [Streptomyces sp. NPDC050529]|uniref:hypothetical protein n=1 Tax=Streptomyces sp. NPDC050529 TaxID=3365624 RepID=UPI0037ACFBFA
MTRLTKQWSPDHAEFQRRDLAASVYVYVWADGVHPAIRLPQTHSCPLVLMGLLVDATKQLTAIAEGLRASAGS